MFRLIMRYLRATLTSLGRHGATALLLLLVAGVSACQDAGEPTRTDAEIREDVVERLEAGSFPDIGAEVADGVVTLRGSAYTQADADRAVALVKSVVGVTSVESQITVGGVASEVGGGMST